jgi:hypothetical protein
MNGKKTYIMSLICIDTIYAPPDVNIINVSEDVIILSIFGPAKIIKSHQACL